MGKANHKDTQAMMGTFVEVTSADKDAARIVFSEIRRIEGLLSKYKEDSEISRLNKTGKLSVSPETFFILQKSRDFWQASEGAFDITVAPLVDLWGFTDEAYRIPQKGMIEKTLASVGFDKIILNADGNVVKFKFPGMKIDLGAIAKGYAVDCAVRKLKENRIASCLINAGGQVFCLGGNHGKPWRIAVRNPRNPGIWEYLELKDKAVSTSGDYEQYFIRGNKRFSHILDPRTGYPSDSGVISATVVAADGLTADALSTSIFILGKQKGLKLAERFKGARSEIIEEKDPSLCSR